VSDPLARNSDPDVSHRAAARARLSLSKTRMVMLGAYYFGAELTPNEAAETLVQTEIIPVARMDSHRRRASELHEMGLIEPTGEERDRGIVYRITWAGKRALQQHSGLTE
jgi:hypothetical protein